MTLLDRAIDGLPIQGALDKDVVVDRTGGWSGAEIAIAVQEAMSRSLLDRTDALTNENLLTIVAERYAISDPEVRRVVHSERTARHESAHAIEGWLRFGGRGAVAMMSLRGVPAGITRLDEERFAEVATVAGFRDIAAMCLAGMAAEQIIYGADGLSSGSSNDHVDATHWLTRADEAARPYAREVLESGHASDRGSERMRGDLYSGLAESSARLLTEVIAELTPFRSAIETLAEALLGAEDQTLSGDGLDGAIEAALAGN